MGTAIAEGILEPIDKSLAVSNVTLTVNTTQSQQRLQEKFGQHGSRLQVLLDGENVKAVEQADIVIIAVKPVKRAHVFGTPGFSDAIRGKLIISIMAGITTAEISRLVGGDQEKTSLQAVRVMPNMAATIREAMSLCAASDALTTRNRDVATKILEQVGKAQFIPEGNFDISAVLVGCAGSLLLLAIDGLLDAAVAEGTKRSEAQNFIMESAIGMLKLVPAGNHPSVLREKIASPGGCSIRALLELEKRGVRSAYTDAIMVAAERSKKMSSS